MSAGERADLIEKFAAIIEGNGETFARHTATQNGGLLVANQTFNIPWGVGVLRYYAHMALNHNFEEPRASAAPDYATADATICHMPIGVVAVIVPFNGPFIQTLAKVGPALAAGCTVVLKPSAAAPLEGFAFAEAAKEAGFPPGVFNVITAARDASDNLLASEDVNHISFTGSTPVGKHIANICASQLKTCSLELGGNAAAVVLDDAPMADIIPGLMMLAYMNNGQACIAQCRILVPKDQHDAYAQALAAGAQSMVLGDPNDPNVHMGPMVTKAAQNTVLDYIKIGQEEGAQLVAGGKVPENLPEGMEEGYFVEPTVFANCTNDMRVSQEEIFGPVITLIPYEDEDHAVELANDQPYGLSSSVWGSPERAVAVGKRIVAGSVYINGALSIDCAVPFGGLKQSGLGSECGPEGFHEYLQEQVIFTPKAAG